MNIYKIDTLKLSIVREEKHFYKYKDRKIPHEIHGSIFSSNGKYFFWP
jgi:hypothetical protein